MLADVLEPLLPHLSVGDVFRLHRALGRDPAWADGTARYLAMRMGYTRRAADVSMADLAMRMTVVKTRCTECGERIRRKFRVCQACADDDGGFRHMCTRAQLRAVAHKWRRRGFKRLLEQTLKPVRRSHCGEFFYYVREAQALLFVVE